MIEKLSLKIESVWTMAASILFCYERSTIETLAANTVQLRELPSLLPVCYVQGTSMRKHAQLAQTLLKPPLLKGRKSVCILCP